MSALVKICGITAPDAMTAAIEGGADFIGLVFHPASPRHLDIEVAAYLARFVPDSVKIVGLFVNPDEDALEQTLNAVRLDMLQLHGEETPEQISFFRRKFGRPVMKAISVSETSDLAKARLYDADWLLLDAKGTQDIPGGTGKSFDWSLLDGFEHRIPWMLAGGLTPENVSGAILSVRPEAVDVSSGVESARGVKNPDKIRAFLRAAKSV